MESTLAGKLAGYKPSSEVTDLIRSTQILLLVGPSGAGKDSLKDRLMQTGRFHHIISHTTRKPRINDGVAEQNGTDYHFIDEATAAQMLEQHKFVEAKVYSNNLYGTSVAEIQKAHNENKIAMTDIEVQGVAEYKALDPGVMAIFLLPPDFETWQARLQSRYGDNVDPVDVQRRLQTAIDEIEKVLNSDHYTVIINKNLDDVLKQVLSIVDSHYHTSTTDPDARQVATQLKNDIQKSLH